MGWLGSLFGQPRMLKANLGEERPEFLEAMIKGGKPYAVCDTQGRSEELSVADMKVALKAKRIMEQADRLAAAGDVPAAKAAYEKFIRTANFEDDVAYYSLANVCIVLRDKSSAKKWLQRALKANPGNAKVRMRLAELDHI